MELTNRIQALIDEIEKMPGVGPKSAERIALFLLSQKDEDVQKLVSAITEAKKNVRLCPECFNLTDVDLCNICSDVTRDRTVICVVEEVRDLFAIEKSREYKGLYHVLHGRIDPSHDMHPDSLRVRELVNRVAKGEVKEVIIATNPNFNGDITAMYLTKLLRPLQVRLTRIATGLPKGTEIDYVDTVTLNLAIKERKEI